MRRQTVDFKTINCMNNMLRDRWSEKIYKKIPSLGELLVKIAKDEEINICCIRHYDLDGVGIEIILRMLMIKFKNLHVEFFEERVRADESFKKIIYNPEYDNHYILIADLSFSSKKFLEEAVDNIGSYRLLANKVFLLDHHESAIWLNDYNWAYVLPHNCKEYIVSSGTQLVFEAFKYLLYTESESFNHKHFAKLEKFVSAVSAYDTYFWKEVPELSSNWYGDLPNDLNVLFKNSDPSNYHKFFIDYIVNNIKEYKIISDTDLLGLGIQKEEIEKCVNRAIEECTKIEIDGKVVVAYYYSGSYVSEIGNALCTQIDCDYAIIINMNVNRVSLRASKDDMNLAQLVDHIENAGGHPKAAGFDFNQIKYDGTGILQFISNIITNNFEYKDK